MNTGTQNSISTIASTSAMRRAWAALRERRLARPPSDALWSYSRDINQRLPALRVQLQADQFQFSPVQQICLRDGTWVSRYEPEDQLVLSRLQEVLFPLCQQRFNLSSACHLKGQGGLKGAVKQAKRYAQRNRFVFKTDIANFYESIDHIIMQQQMNQAVKDQRVRRLVWDSMERLHVCNGEYRHVKTKGISRGCSLSPLMGAVYLTPLDAYAKENKLDYVRYMDDILFFTKTRHKLKKVIRDVYPILNQLKLTLADDKTWIGRVAKGFDYLGYRIAENELTVAQRSFQRMTARLHQRLAQGESTTRLVSYVKNWLRWAQSGVVLDKERLVKTIKNILQNTLGFHQASVLLPD